MKSSYRVSYRDNVTHSPNKLRIHASNSSKLYYFHKSEGKMRFFIDGALIELNPGEVIYVKKGSFTGTLKKSKVAYARCVSLFPEGLAAFLSTVDTDTAQLLSDSAVFRLDEDGMREYESIISSLDKEVRGVKAVELIMRQLLVLHCQECKKLDGPPNDSLTAKILSKLDEESLVISSAAEIASALGYSQNYLSKFFKQKMNISLHDFLIAKKLFIALQMLTSGKSVTETAYTCGFSSTSHFISVFRAHYGKTPRQYVKEIVEN